MIAPLPPNEADRVAALRALGVLDTPPEPPFDDLARLAAYVCGTPIALVSLIDVDRQWFKARVGLDAAQTPRDLAFCAHAILDHDLFVVPDATADARFADNPLVAGDPSIRFYAGMPLTTPEGFALGTICVIDKTPRTLSPAQADALRALGRQVVAQLVERRRGDELEALLAENRRIETELRASEERFRAFMDNSPAVAYMKDEAGRFVYVNEPLAARFGRPAAEWLGRTDHDLFPAEFADKFRTHDQQVLAADRPVEYTEVTPTDAGPVHWRSYKFPFTDVAGGRVLAGMSVDVTAELRVEAALRASEAKFRNTVDRLAEGVCVFDPATGRFVEANATLLALLGYTLDEFVALDPFALSAGESPEEFAANVAERQAQLARDGRSDVGRRWFRRKDGTPFPVDIRVSVVPTWGAELHAVIVRDVTDQVEYENRLFEYQSELEDANARLRAVSITDGLTGVLNRAAFDGKLVEEYDRATRHHHPLSVVLLDVDHFKRFNDTFGHPAGDAVLRAVAETLKTVLRSSDAVARYGGEEFVVVLPDTDAAGAMVLAERCRRAIGGVAWDLRPVTISVGVASLLPTTADPAALVSAADAALYRAKAAGRNRVMGDRPAGRALAPA